MSLQGRWDDEAERWVAWAREPGHDTYWRFHREAFFELLPPVRGRALDLGCGEGRVARDLEALGYDVAAVDASPTMVEHARAASPRLEVVAAEAAAMPFADASFDLVVAFMSLMNVDDLDAVVAETARVLVPAGLLCIAMTHPLNTAGSFASEGEAAPFVIEEPYFEERTVSHETRRAGLAVTLHDRHRPLERYTEALAASGFVVERLREVTVGDRLESRDRQARWSRLPMFLHLRGRRLA
ncbi:MAG: class I SAM-dependent methyltransferase [Gaiellales bacterium]